MFNSNFILANILASNNEETVTYVICLSCSVMKTYFLTTTQTNRNSGTGERKEEEHPKKSHEFITTLGNHPTGRVEGRSL
jgi:hypothetical protein